MGEPLLLEAEHVGWWIKYGPVPARDPNDIFQLAQSIAPDGWHIENQMVRFPAGWRAQATRRDRTTATAWGSDRAEAMANLLRGLHDGQAPR